MNENYKKTLIQAYMIVREYECREDDFVVEQKKVIQQANEALTGYYKNDTIAELIKEK